ncbi:MAG: hypothetical protein DHS20C14_21480 [Phycisphaeraceae bacterium]|nr:MAG: hypothetical protein DHS20C14_21480 [Phycisphaeraceae bacterium]
MTPSLPHPHALLAIAGLVAGLAAPAWAQVIDDPTELEDAERDMPRQRPASEPVSPTVEPGVDVPAPGLTGGHAWPDETQGDTGVRATRLPEGATLIKRPGRVLTMPTGHRVFVVDPAERRAGEGAMLIFPCRQLARLDASIDGASSASVVLSGFVYEYAGRNYVLPTAFSRDAYQRPAVDPVPDQAAPGEDGAAPAERETASDAPSEFDDPDIAALLTELDDSPAIRAVAPPTPRRVETPDGSVAISTGTDGFVADGTPITRRRARLVRGGGGAWAFRFDNDFDSASAAGEGALDHPLTVMPCRLLETLEKLAMTEGDGVELLVSGRVYTYGQRRYILPTIFQRPLKLGIDPMQ